MKILVSQIIESAYKGFRPSNNESDVSLVSMFKSKQEFDRAVGLLKLPFYVIDLKEKLEKDHFNSLISRIRSTSVETILDAEAMQMVKKRKSSNDDIIKMIVQVG